MVLRRAPVSVSSTFYPTCERHERAAPGTLMTCLLIVAPSTPMAGGSSVPFEQTIPQVYHTCITMVSSGLSCTSPLLVVACCVQTTLIERSGRRCRQRQEVAQARKPPDIGKSITSWKRTAATELTPGFEWSHRMLILGALGSGFVMAL